MKLELQTERLTLRPIDLDDLDLALELFTDEEVSRHIGGLQTAEKIEREMPTYIKRCGGGCIGIWCIIDKSNNEKIGTSILLPLPIDIDDTDWDLIKGSEIPDGDIEIGYVLKKPVWGKGIATEAGKRLLQFAFEETSLLEVVATLEDENVKSRHVLEKMGLREVGRRLAYGVENSADFRITKDDWLDRSKI